jgi:hypothetical protein
MFELITLFSVVDSGLGEGDGRTVLPGGNGEPCPEDTTLASWGEVEFEGGCLSRLSSTAVRSCGDCGGSRLDGKGYFRGLPRGRLATVGGGIRLGGLDAFANVGLWTAALDWCVGLEGRASTLDSVGKGGYILVVLGWFGFIQDFCLPPSPPKARLSVC